MARTIVGLDIGSSGARAAEFALGRRVPSLRRFATVPLPHGAVQAGVVIDGEAVTDALRTLWSKGRFSTKDVSVGVGNAGILVRQMDLDWMPPADFRKALRYQVEDALPIPVEDANLDYHLLDEIEVPGEGEETRPVARILLVAAARDMVDGFVQAAYRAGLRPLSVDIVPFALIRARYAGGSQGSPSPEAIVDIGADVVTVVVHQGGQPRYVRTIAGHGGDVITRALQERYDWAWEDAERTKIIAALPGHADLHNAEITTGGLEHPAQRVITAEVEALVSEIATTVDYFRGSTTDTPTLDRVLLAGSAARLGGLQQVLEERLALTVEPLTVLGRLRKRRRVKLDEQDQAALVVPAGLCTGTSL